MQRHPIHSWNPEYASATLSARRRGAATRGTDRSYCSKQSTPTWEENDEQAEIQASAIDGGRAIRRRQFLKQIGTGAAVATAALAAPNVARAQDKVTLKFQSTWPAKDIFNEFAGDYVAKVNEMAGGRLELQLLAAGAVVKAFELQQAVNDGILDGGHGVCAYWYGKSKAYSLFGTAPALGWNANQMLGWISTAAARRSTRNWSARYSVSIWSAS